MELGIIFNISVQNEKKMSFRPYKKQKLALLNEDFKMFKFLLFIIHINWVTTSYVSYNIVSVHLILGVRGSAVGWGIMLQAGRLRVRVLMR
jgi:hypothetical protein